jgi:hypothetical protein
MADQQPRLLELGQHAVNRREADVEPFAQQHLVDVLGGQMPDLDDSKRLMILRRGSVALRPALFRSWGEVIGLVQWAGKTSGYNSAEGLFAAAFQRRPSQFAGWREAFRAAPDRWKSVQELRCLVLFPARSPALGAFVLPAARR